MAIIKVQNYTAGLGEYIALMITTQSGCRYRLIVDVEEDSCPNEIRLYEENDDNPVMRMPLK